MRCDDVAMHVFSWCDEATPLIFHTAHDRTVISTLSDRCMCSQVRSMSYAGDNCRDGFSACSIKAVWYIIKIYSVLIFPLVALLHGSFARAFTYTRCMFFLMRWIDAILNVHTACDKTIFSTLSDLYCVVKLETCPMRAIIAAIVASRAATPHCE